MTAQGHHIKKTVTSGPGWKQVELHSEDNEPLNMAEMGPIIAGMMHKSMMSGLHGKNGKGNMG